MVALNIMKNVLIPNCLAGKRSAAGRGKVLLHCIGECSPLQRTYGPALHCGPCDHFQLRYRETELLLGASKLPRRVLLEEKSHMLPITL